MRVCCACALLLFGLILYASDCMALCAGNQIERERETRTDFLSQFTIVHGMNVGAATAYGEQRYFIHKSCTHSHFVHLRRSTEHDICLCSVAGGVVSIEGPIWWDCWN